MMRKKIISKDGHRLSLTRKPHVCDGCGRVLPKHSWVLMWSIWTDFHYRNRIRLCSDCQDICYNCNTRREMRYGTDEYLIRDICETCDSFPWCDRVDYLRGSKPGDLCLGDLDGVIDG